MTRFGLDERNIARLNPVLALSRVHLSMTAWKKTTLLNSGAVSLTCDAGKHQVPHGVDADVIFALLTAYHLQGRPDDHTIHMSVGYLCDLVGLDRSASKYQRIQESIQRLKAVQFKTEAFWGNQNKKTWQWTNMEFGIIDYLGATEEFEDSRDISGKYSKRTSLTIRLNKELVTSIQNDYTRKIDLDFYAKLNYPLSRLLYRLLEEQRQIVGKDVYQVPVIGWGEHLGFCEVDTSIPLGPKDIPVTKTFGASRIRRALQPAHEELLAKHYLSDVVYCGYASQQQLIYTFSGESVTNPVDIDLVGKLISRGIAKEAAKKCLVSHGSEVIKRAVTIFDTRLGGGYTPKNKSGFMMDIINNPDKYANVIDESQELHKVLNDSKNIQTNSSQEKALVPVLDEKTEELSGPTEEQGKMLRGMLKKLLLSEATVTRLLDAVMASQLPLSEVATLTVYKDTALSAKVEALLARLPSSDGDH
ncbi:hypothetical protein ASF71_18455 [Deinococcus sp. Leaf326]|nr:hypothetical protein ASF71_18455 [Deinococcus sp. Leaf326]